MSPDDSSLNGPPDVELFCPNCGYNLRGIQSERCPECGLTVDRDAIAASVLPWIHRAKFGRVSAFLRTIGFILRNPRRAAKQAMYPISYRDAQLFRWLVIVIAAVPLCVAVLLVRGIAGDVMLPLPDIRFAMSGSAPLSPIWDYLISAWAGLMLWPVPSIAIVLTLAAFTGAPSFFFSPRTLPVVRQNRAIALSYYGCAPLVLTFIPCLCIAGAMLMEHFGWTERQRGFQVAAILGIIGVASPLSLVAMCWFNTLYLLHATLQASFWRLLATGVLLLIVWLGLALLTLGLFPIVCGFFRLFFIA